MVERITVAADAPLTDDADLTISEFCRLAHISTPTYFSLQRKGLGPETITIPGTRIVRISPQARREWRERMRELSATETAKLEARRRREQASRAGKLAVASPLHVSKRRST
jgi:hypothetical protein